MSLIKVYWRGWTEGQLAGYQQDQGSTNHCAKYAAASALNMLYGTALLGNTLASWVENRPLKGTARYTIFGNHNGSLVYQTANLVRKLGHLQDLAPGVRCYRGTALSIQEMLKNGNSLNLVSVTYLQGKEPLITRGENTTSSLGPARLVGGHLMILGAYDQGHKNRAGASTPWGFISSWGNQEQLYWMTEEDFFRTWGRLSFFNMVTVRRT